MPMAMSPGGSCCKLPFRAILETHQAYGSLETEACGANVEKEKAPSRGVTGLFGGLIADNAILSVGGVYGVHNDLIAAKTFRRKLPIACSLWRVLFM